MKFSLCALFKIVPLVSHLSRFNRGRCQMFSSAALGYIAVVTFHQKQAESSNCEALREMEQSGRAGGVLISEI